MKTIVTLFTFILSFGLLTAQGDSNLSVTQNIETFVKAADARQINSGSSISFINPKRDVLGSVYLFDDWKNYGIIFTLDDRKFRLNNINLNIQRNTFVAKISNDSIFTFNFNNIKEFVINNKVFKNIYSKNGKRVYEVIYENEAYTILKGFSIQIVAGSSNPMVNRSSDKFVRKSSYYLLKNNNVTPFRFKKKSILKLLGEEEKTKLSQFVSTNKLSYKKAYDMKKALDFINK